MSEDVMKTAFRIGPFYDLKGKSDAKAYKYFKKHLGEPDIVDEQEGEVLWFEYAYPFDIFAEKGQWYLDIIVGGEVDPPMLRGGIKFDIEDAFKNLEEYIPYSLYDEIVMKGYPVDFVAYCWYNGKDEPSHSSLTRV